MTFDTFKAIYGAKMTVIAQQTIEVIKERIDTNGIKGINDMNFKDELGTNIYSTGDGIFTEITMPGYAWYTEHGRAPGGDAPVSIILDWIKRTPDFDAGNSREEELSAAFAVSKKIGKFGTEGKDFKSLAQNYLSDQAFLALSESVADIFAQFVSDMEKINKAV